MGVMGWSINIGMIGESPEIPNPILYGQNKQTDLILKFLFRWLLRYDAAKWTYEWDIATCDISDLSKISCILKDNQLWSDGTKIQVEDIVATYQAFRTSAPNDKIKAFLWNVSVVSKGPKNIELSSKEKNSLMLDLLSYPIIRSDLLERIRTNRLAVDGYVTSWLYTFTGKDKNTQYGYDRVTIEHNQKNQWDAWLDKYNFLFFPDTTSLERSAEHLNIILPSIKQEKLLLSPRFGSYDYTLQEYIGTFLNTDNLSSDLRKHLVLQVQWSLSGMVAANERPVSNVFATDSGTTVIKLQKNLPDVLKDKWYKKIDERLAILDKETGILTWSSVTYGSNNFIDTPSRSSIIFSEVADGNMLISGRVPAGTKSVSINGYTLREFSPGNPRFSYKIGKAIGTLLDGKNVYNVEFESAAWVKSVRDVLTLYYYTDTDKLQAAKDAVEKEYLAKLNTPELIGERMKKVMEQRIKIQKLDPRYYYNDKLEPFSLNITYISEPASLEKYATTMSNALTSIGIKSTLTSIDGKGLATMLEKGAKNYDFIIVGFEASWRLSRIGQIFLSSEAKNWINFAKIESKNLDTLFANLRVANTDAQVEEISAKIRSYIISEAFFFPISSPLHTLYIDKNLKGIPKIDTFQDITTLYTILRRASIKESYILKFEGKGIFNFMGWVWTKAWK